MQISKKLFDLETENAFEILIKVNKLQSKGKNVINLGIGQPDFPTPRNIVEAGIKALRDGHHGYTHSNGIPKLREAVAEDIFKSYDVKVNPENILITPGGKPTIFFSILMFGDNNSEIIYPDPGFPIYRSMIKFTGTKPVPLELKEKNNFEIDIEHLASLITNKTKLIIINNPHNPTGSFMDKSKITELVKKLEEFPNVAILSDEIYSKFIFDGKKMPSLLEYEDIRNRLIVLEGLSKTFCMTGWRLGWSVWPKNLIKHAIKLCVNDHSCPSVVSQYAGIEAIKGSKHEVNKMISEFQKRRNFIFDKLNKLSNLSCFKPRGAFYAYPNVSKTGLSGNQFAELALNEYNVAVVPGTSFGETSKDFVRISYANTLANIEEALTRLSKI